MKNKLVVDTSKQCAYILLTNNEMKFFKILNEQSKVSENLLPEIDKIITQSGVKLSELDALCVVTGPGSFTGIRVGLSSIKAISQALGVKIIAKNFFEIMRDCVGDGIFLIKCTNTSTYVAEYKDNEIIDVNVLSNDLIDSQYLKNSKFQLENEICYNGDSVVITDYLDILNKFFEQCIIQEDFVDAEIVEPYYVQPSQAELNLNKKA